MADQDPPPPAAPNNASRTWLITSALSQLSVRLIRALLAHGDHVVACFPHHEIEDPNRSAEFKALVEEVKSSRPDRAGWRARFRGVRCDGVSRAGCNNVIRDVLTFTKRIDILLCCRSEAVVGTVEELGTNVYTQSLVASQFESIFFSQVNFIKAALPVMRKQSIGHIIALTSTGGHIGTPGMPMYTAATWALEGYCDSLAYEVAPFNIKVTIVQPNKEIQSLTNRLIFAPQLPAYEQRLDSVPNVRDMFARVLNSDPETALPPDPSPQAEAPPASPASTSLEPDVAPGRISRRYVNLPPGAADELVMETVHALVAIGGHENPPARHIVGHEGATAVKEKLRTVSQELEDFVKASLSVDIFESELQQEARSGGTREATPKTQESRQDETGE